jgi:hypothetical protein
MDKCIRSGDTPDWPYAPGSDVVPALGGCLRKDGSFAIVREGASKVLVAGPDGSHWQISALGILLPSPSFTLLLL